MGTAGDSVFINGIILIFKSGSCIQRDKGFGEMNQARQEMEKIHAVWTKHINDQTK